MEWEGEYRRYRRVYKHAMEEAKLGRRLILIAAIGEQIVGQIFVQLGSIRYDFNQKLPSGYFHAFRVRPEFRNRGIGTRLLLEAEAALKGIGHLRAIITAAKDNPDARRLYERLGYSIFAEDPGDWSYVDDKGILRRVHEPSFVLEKRI
jgi:GNAT superfamily N-acetyltransferase